MKRLIVGGLVLQLCVVPALAATTLDSPTAAPTGGPTTQPLPEPSNTRLEDGGIPGANSLTEGQARIRLERNGYREVSALTKGDDGVWRGSALRNGTAVDVTVNAKGSVSTGGTTHQ